MKDNFSSASDKYARYRPTYPKELFDFINSIVQNKQTAWDCGTGNGQIAAELANTFNEVYATDISQSQIDNAVKLPHIIYSVQPAEKTDFPDDRFDLVVVAQAIHWFDFDKFYQEVRRTSKTNAFIVVVGYGMIKVSEEIDPLILHFYENIIGAYWDKERRYIDENYQTLPFPFEEIQTPSIVNKPEWDLGHLIGYLNTWSAVKHFIKQNGRNPVDDLKPGLEKYWNEVEVKNVEFPLLLRVGKVQKHFP